MSNTSSITTWRTKAAPFFHLQPNRKCTQNKKTLAHLQVQLYFLKILENDCILEHRFSQISRIADVVWLSKKIIFEVQCSPISLEEIQNRNKDYASLGYQVVWILHEKRFNRHRASPVEVFLQRLPMYYTDINDNGNGGIYDQFFLMKRGYKRNITPRMPIDIGTVLDMAKMESVPQKVASRIIAWPYCFKNDLSHFCMENPSYADHLAKLESQSQEKKQWLKEALFNIFIRPYLSLFRTMLENACH